MLRNVLPRTKVFIEHCSINERAKQNDHFFTKAKLKLHLKLKAQLLMWVVWYNNVSKTKNPTNVLIIFFMY